MTRIFIISTHVMFSRGLASLLHQEAGLDIVGQETDMDRAIGRVKELQPDVILLDSYGSAPEVMLILKASLESTVISLNLQNNNLYIYQARHWTVKDVDDLLKAIYIPTSAKLIGDSKNII